TGTQVGISQIALHNRIRGVLASRLFKEMSSLIKVFLRASNQTQTLISPSGHGRIQQGLEGVRCLLQLSGLTLCFSPQHHDLRVCAILLFHGFGIGQGRKVAALFLRLFQHAYRHLLVSRPALFPMLNFLALQEGFLFLLLTHQLIGGVRGGTRHQQSTPQTQSSPAHQGTSPYRHFHQSHPPATWLKPRNKARKPDPAVIINKAGSKVSTMTPVIFTVSLPTLAFSSRRRCSRKRTPKRCRGSCIAPPCWSTCTIRRQITARSSLVKPLAIRSNDCSRVRP